NRRLSLALRAVVFRPKYIPLEIYPARVLILALKSPHGIRRRVFPQGAQTPRHRGFITSARTRQPQRGIAAEMPRLVNI
ncbi:MAG: hypothetical protein ACYDDA_13995, partial [Acidiferrobacteraceae bacterium]